MGNIAPRREVQRLVPRLTSSSRVGAAAGDDRTRFARLPRLRGNRAPRGREAAAAAGPRRQRSAHPAQSRPAHGRCDRRRRVPRHVQLAARLRDPDCGAEQRREASSRRSAHRHRRQGEPRARHQRPRRRPRVARAPAQARPDRSIVPALRRPGNANPVSTPGVVLAAQGSPSSSTGGPWRACAEGAPGPTRVGAQRSWAAWRGRGTLSTWRRGSHGHERVATSCPWLLQGRLLAPKAQHNWPEGRLKG